MSPLRPVQFACMHRVQRGRKRGKARRWAWVRLGLVVAEAKVWAHGNRGGTA